MPAPRRPPMPKRPPAVLGKQKAPSSSRAFYLSIFFVLFAIPLVITHWDLLSLPFFWDEMGQFIPSALDVLHGGALIAHSTVPNVHPPGLAIYLALCFKILGFSELVTRAAMLLIAAAGLLFTFLLAIELSQGAKGAPAFFPPLFLLASPIFFTQSLLAQLDMPAMTFTVLAMLLYVKRRYAWAAAACVVLVLVKETGLVTPLAFAVVLLWSKQWKQAALFAIPAGALAAWLVFLHARTGHWLGNAEFAAYNVSYAIHPVRIGFAFLRRIYYIFFAEFRWVGVLVLAGTFFYCKSLQSRQWIAPVMACLGTIVLISVCGGAELERYTLPVLPLFYIAVSIGISSLKKPVAIGAGTILLAGLAWCIFLRPLHPAPFENNYAMVDFLHLEQTAAIYAENNLRGRTIATAWPYTQALARPEYGFVNRALTTVETHDLHFESVRALPADSFDTLIVYTREWPPGNWLTTKEWARRILRHFYGWNPDIVPEECERLGLREKISWSLRGQTVAIYYRNGGPDPDGRPAQNAARRGTKRTRRG